MKEQEQVPVWRLVLSSQKGPTQQQQQQQLQCEASSLSWSLVSSGCFLSASGSSSSSQPAAIPPFTRLCFVEAKTSTILNSSMSLTAIHETVVHLISSNFLATEEEKRHSFERERNSFSCTFLFHEYL